MSNPFLGEIRMFGFNFAPRDYVLCNGQEMPISENQALFALLGVTYGGDGRSTFGLPNFKGRVPVHRGQSYPLGYKDGVEDVTINLATLAMHTHQAIGTTEVGEAIIPSSSVSFATSTDQTGDPIYSPPTTSMVALNSNVIGYSAGNGLPHNNVQPSQVINFCIAVSGQFPPRN